MASLSLHLCRDARDVIPTLSVHGLGRIYPLGQWQRRMMFRPRGYIGTGQPVFGYFCAVVACRFFRLKFDSGGVTGGGLGVSPLGDSTLGRPVLCPFR